MARRAAAIGPALFLLLAVAGCRDRDIEAGFWFEPVSFEAPGLGGTLTPDDLHRIESVARTELAQAFEGLRIVISDRRDARYKVNVVQRLLDPRFRRPWGGAGQSRAIRGFGGWGSVSFEFLASGALAYAPPEADRDTIIEAIGRGIGRTAVHELTHQLLPTAPIHDSTNVRSYEFASAARREQYYGDMEWGLARPLLERRVGLSSLSRGNPYESSSH
jgi:hypothetical protein